MDILNRCLHLSAIFGWRSEGDDTSWNDKSGFCVNIRKTGVFIIDCKGGYTGGDTL